jgi:hypothetical protein
MSMPGIELDHIDRNKAINNVIASIALEEAALSHILNAEGEKIQAAINIPGITLCELIELNKTVVQVVDCIGHIEEKLQNKLCIALNQKQCQKTCPEINQTFMDWPSSPDIHSQTVSQVPFLVRKEKPSGEPINGGEFFLSSQDFFRSTTAKDGVLDFGSIPISNAYELSEKKAPPGYFPDKSVYRVNITPQGQITVDGKTGTFTIVNTPIGEK